MKNLIKIFSLAFFLTVVFNLQGQDAAPRSYNSIAYMKVEPGMHDEYVELEKAWQKIHQRNIDAGKYGSWHVYQVLYPNGANESYNYIVRTHLENEDQLAAYINNYSMPDDWKSILSEEEIALIDKTSEIRTWVNSEIWATLEYVSNEGDDNEITVFNFFSIPEGSSRTAHQKMENEVWKPVHQARMNDGQMEGWAMLTRRLPYGSDNPYVDGTVDIYKDMDQLIKSQTFPYFEDVHPGVSTDDIFEQTLQVCDLRRSEVRKKLLSAAKSN